MKSIELPCVVGDTIYYITEWNKYSHQQKHNEEVIKIEIMEDETIFKTKFRTFLLSKYNKTWFIEKERYEKESNIVRQLHIKEQELRAKVTS